MMEKSAMHRSFRYRSFFFCHCTFYLFILHPSLNMIVTVDTPEDGYLVIYQVKRDGEEMRVPDGRTDGQPSERLGGNAAHFPLSLKCIVKRREGEAFLGSKSIWVDKEKILFSNTISLSLSLSPLLHSFIHPKAPAPPFPPPFPILNPQQLSSLRMKGKCVERIGERILAEYKKTLSRNLERERERERMRERKRERLLIELARSLARLIFVYSRFSAFEDITGASGHLKESIEQSTSNARTTKKFMM